MSVTPHPGRCTRCGLRRDVFPVSRTGGGTYNRGGRFYRSSICGQCALVLLDGAGTHSMASSSRYSVDDLWRIAAVMDPDAADAYQQRRAADRAARTEARRRP